VTARATDRTPQTAAPGVQTADSSSAENRLLWRVPPEEIAKTVLVKNQAKPDGKEPPPQPD
jgi:hypothetical protein